MRTVQRSLLVVALLGLTATAQAKRVGPVVRQAGKTAWANVVFHGLRVVNRDFRTQFSSELRFAGVPKLQLGLRWVEAGGGMGAMAGGGWLATLGHSLNIPELVYWGLSVAAAGSVFAGDGVSQASHLVAPAKRGTVESMRKELAPWQLRVFEGASWSGKE